MIYLTKQLNNNLRKDQASGPTKELFPIKLLWISHSTGLGL